jgi:hypothetical protein
VFIVFVILCAVFRLIVVLFCVMCVVCVLCLIVVPLLPGENPFAVKINIYLSAYRLIVASFLLGVQFDLQSGRDAFLRNVCRFLPNCTALQPRSIKHFLSLSSLSLFLCTTKHFRLAVTLETYIREVLSSGFCRVMFIVVLLRRC